MVLSTLFGRILNMSLAAGTVTVLVLAVRFLLRRRPKIFSYVLWAAVLFRLLCPVAPESKLSAFGLVEDIMKPTHYTAYYDETILVKGNIVSETGLIPQKNEPQHQQVSKPKAPVPVLPLIWLAGTVGMLACGAAGALKLKKRLSGAVWQRENVFLTDCVGTPFVMGLRQPRIYLPRGIGERERFYIVSHEWHHINRGDHVVKIIAYLALSIHWFNPLVWLAFFLSEKDMEMSCDEAVLEELGESIRADYAASLLCYAGGYRMARGVPLSFGESSTKSRVMNLARWRSVRWCAWILCGVLCVLTLLTCVTDPVAATAAGTSAGVYGHEEMSAEGQVLGNALAEEHRAEARKYLGTWYMEGYYNVTVTVSERYDPYTNSSAMYLDFSEYAPKLPVTIPYKHRQWIQRMPQYGIELLGDRISVRTSMGESCIFVRERGSKDILNTYPHLKAFGTWDGAEDPGEYAVVTKMANLRQDKYYQLRMWMAEYNDGQYSAHEWYTYENRGWFNNTAGNVNLTVEDNALRIYTAHGTNLFAEFDLSKNNISYAGNGAS